MAAHIRKNDTVLVISGKDRGKRGPVERIIPKDGRLVVAGVNMIKRHTKGRPGVRQAGIIERPGALSLSNVILICTHCSKPTRVGLTILENGRKVRRCKKCNETID
ncbi:MAG: 50S ribosomal protein L24 [Chloroflexi bacterium]|nr:50S ribosomal protein L24 [Chloroflexota bacterium]